MLIIDGHKITLTRGDTMTIMVSILKDNEPYEIQEGDSIRFALSTGYKAGPGYTLILSKEIPTDTLIFTLSSAETELAYRNYNYDIEITHSDGSVDTFISSTLRIIGEVK